MDHLASTIGRIRSCLRARLFCLPAFGITGFAMLILFVLGGCSTLERAGLWSPLGPDGFHGVRFGDSFTDVQLRFPGGAPQTSPLGANSYRLSSVSDQGVFYESVVYEFVDRAGMQLVLAHFGSQAAPVILASMRSQLGPELMEPSSTPDAPPTHVWTISNGEMVRLDTSSHRLILLGPSGQILKQDIDLRERPDFAALDR